jgi:hypothetical protein
MAKVFEVDEIEVEAGRDGSSKVPGFWKARGVEGFGLTRREVWVYRRRRFEMLMVFGPDESRI